MKIAYLGKIQISDTDLPFLHEAQQMADITYLLEVTPRYLKGPAFNIPSIYPHTGIFKATEAYPEFSRLSGFIDTDKFYVVNTCGRLWQLKSFWTYFLLLLFLVRRHFNVIHLVWPPNIYEFIIYFLRRKMILTVHDPFPHSGLDTFIVRLRRKAAFALIPKLIILNEKQRQDFIDYYKIAPERVINSHLSCCTYLQTLLSGDEQPSLDYILFAGKISQYKGLDYLLPAMKQVHQQCPDCKLIVAGAGSFHFDISEYQQLDYIEIRNRFIPDSELVELIYNSAFMICPYTDATQSGVIMSAYAFSKPMIATNVGGLPEMVKDGHYGLLIPEKNVDALADSIVSLWKNPERVSTFSREIREAYATGDVSWNATAKKIVDEYHKQR